MWAKTEGEKPQPETEMETKPEMELEKDSGTYVADAGDDSGA